MSYHLAYTTHLFQKRVIANLCYQSILRNLRRRKMSLNPKNKTVNKYNRNSTVLFACRICVSLMTTRFVGLRVPHAMLRHSFHSIVSRSVMLSV